MPHALAFLRFLILLLHFGLFLILAGVLCLFVPVAGRLRWRLSAFWGRVWARCCCAILNLRIRQKGTSPQGGPFLIVANHIGMPDVFVLNALFPGFFVAKLDVKRWPLIGWMAGVGGAVYVNRERRQSAGSLVGEMVRRLKKGINVFMFPEGGATDGSALMPFKTPGFESVIRTGHPVLPVVLTYHDGNTPSVACWYNISFLEHLWNVLKTPQLEVTAQMLPAVSGPLKRRELAQQVRDEMSRVYDRG